MILLNTINNTHLKILCLSALLFGGQLFSEVPKKTFLWELTGKNNSVYLLGSIHVADSSFYPLPKVITSAWEKSKILAVEVDLTAIPPLEMQQTVLKYAQFDQGKTLSTAISKRDHSTLKRFVNDTLGLSIAQLEQFKPWYVCQIITIGMLQRVGFDPSLGIDMYFLNNAPEKKRISLETFDGQLKMFDEVGSDSAFISYTLQSADSTYELIDEMMRAWKYGDEKNLEKLMFLEINTPSYKKFFELLFFKRNLEMLEKIEKLATLPDDVFVVVGAGHLVSDKGIIELLKKKGYKINRK